MIFVFIHCDVLLTGMWCLTERAQHETFTFVYSMIILYLYKSFTMT